jgi:hypothetical protein
VVVVSDGRFAGVDWAGEEHAVCVVDERGRIVEVRRYRHNETGIRALCARLLRLRVVLVALERPDGLLIERLLDAGLAVVAVQPNQVKAMRPRFSVAGGKSDSFDGFVLAELARTDGHRFRVLEPDGDQTKALRAMTRARAGLVRTRIGLANQLRDQLACFWPAPATCSARWTRRSRWRSSSATHPPRCPRPGRAAPSGVSQAPRVSGPQAGSRPARPAARRRRGPRRRARDPGATPGRDGARLRARADRRRISELTIEIRHALQAHPDRATFCSLLIAQDSWLCAATMLAEIGDRRDRYPTHRALAADAGQCPVAVEPGKARHAQFRWACDHRLRQAIRTLSDASRRHNPRAADIYDRARARGASHTHATRILGRAWSQIIRRLWHDYDTYDPPGRRELLRRAHERWPAPRWTVELDPWQLTAPWPR